jgi:ABC-type phosphate transport system substrate-binding protein
MSIHLGPLKLMTTRTRSMLLCGLLAILPSLEAGAVESGRFMLVVNGSRPTTLTRRQVADFFLKRASSWPDGASVAPIDLSVASPTREAFSRKVLGQPTEAIVHYWQQQMYSGRLTPPLVKPEDGVLAIVKSTPGGIGYVAEGTPLPDGVKAVSLIAD